jgi:hypothetical protein
VFLELCVYNRRCGDLGIGNLSRFCTYVCRTVGIHIHISECFNSCYVGICIYSDNLRAKYPSERCGCRVYTSSEELQENCMYTEVAIRMLW